MSHDDKNNLKGKLAWADIFQINGFFNNVLKYTYTYLPIYAKVDLQMKNVTELMHDRYDSPMQRRVQCPKQHFSSLYPCRNVLGAFNAHIEPRLPPSPKNFLGCGKKFSLTVW